MSQATPGPSRPRAPRSSVATSGATANPPRKQHRGRRPLHSDEALQKQADTISKNTNIPVSLQQTTPLIGARPPKSLGRIADKKLRSHLSRVALQQRRAREHAKVVDEVLNAPPPGEDQGRIETEDALERTARVTQAQIRQSVAVEAASKSFALDLSGGRNGVGLGPYRCDYTRNGRHLLLGGRSGHLAALDWQTGKLLCEVNVKETVRDVRWLHNQSFFAAAQKKYVYIYDSSGAEVHRLKDHIEVQRMEFLPYHFLLATVGNAGWLKYQDTSTGSIVAQHRTGLGSCSTMAQNPLTAVVHLGHANGTVTLWTPNLSSAALKLLAHRGPVSGVAVSSRDGGREMATAGLEGSIKVWDSRMLGRGAVREWASRKPASELRYSQRGLLGVAWGSHVSVYDTKAPLGNAPPGPYLTNGFPGAPPINLAWAPFEDVLGVAHAKGFESLVVPGAGEPRFDSMELDPYEGKTRRREREVHALLDKIQPDLITLDPEMLGSLDAGSLAAKPREAAPTTADGGALPKSADGRPYARLSRLERLRLDGRADEGADAAVRDGSDDEQDLASEDAGAAQGEDSFGPRRTTTAGVRVGVAAKGLGGGGGVAGGDAVREKKKMRGKNSAMRRFLRKKAKNVVDAKSLAVRAKLERSREERQRLRESRDGATVHGGADGATPKSALDHLAKRPNRRRRGAGGGGGAA